MIDTQIYIDLVNYLGGPTAAAKKMGVKQSSASGWASGKHGMSVKSAIEAERITDGEYKASDLNEDLKHFNPKQ